MYTPLVSFNCLILDHNCCQKLACMYMTHINIRYSMLSLSHRFHNLNVGYIQFNCYVIFMLCNCFSTHLEPSGSSFSNYYYRFSTLSNNMDGIPNLNMEEVFHAAKENVDTLVTKLSAQFLKNVYCK